MLQIGDYEFNLAESYGKGSFGTIFKGKHLTTGNDVAGKKLTVEKEFENRYDKEANLLKNIPPHPNVLRVCDIEKREYEQGGIDYVDIWIITELLHFPLRGYAKQYELSLEDKLELMIGCCRGLYHLHQNGIIHRDLKPDNIMIKVKEDGKPVIKIIDFGESRFVDRYQGRTLEMNSFVGTPLYMAPEQLEREGNRCTPNYTTSVDVFALGITFLSLVKAKAGILMETYKGIYMS